MLVWPKTPTIAILPEFVSLESLPPKIDGSPVIGIADDTLEPLAIPMGGIFLVSGPPGSGKSTAVITTVAAICRTMPDAVTACIGAQRSSLVDSHDWKYVSRGQAGGIELARTLSDLLTRADGECPIDVVVLEGLGELANSEADGPVLDLLHACSDSGVMVIAEGAPNEIAGPRPLLQMVRGARHGVALQPEQNDGDTLFKTTFPRINRTEYPVGRGLYVRKGGFVKVQLAATSAGDAV